MDTLHLTRLHARARRLTASPQDAEDLCQDVCLALLERQARGGQIDRPLPYMMTALRHAAQVHRRKSARLSPIEDADLPEVADASLACFCAEVLGHIENLPKGDRLLLRRVVLDGTTPSELAEDLSIPLGTVMSRLARARARLRAVVGQGRLS